MALEKRKQTVRRSLRLSWMNEMYFGWLKKVSSRMKKSRPIQFHFQCSKFSGFKSVVVFRNTRVKNIRFTYAIRFDS